MCDNLVVIIDSGVDIGNVNIMEHVEGGCGFKYINGSICETKNINDKCGHGTNCADLILRLNSDLKLYIIKIVDENGKSSSELMIKALEKCLDIDARIICMSLSVITQKCDYERNIKEVCKKLCLQNKIICVSEHNEMKFSQPAKFREVIGVRAYYQGKKEGWHIEKSSDIQVVADGYPVFLKGKAGNYNFFKGSSKANAFFVGKLSEFHKSNMFHNMWDALDYMKRKEFNLKLEEQNIEFGIGYVPRNSLEEYLERVIRESIKNIGKQEPSIELLRQAPIMSRITGISYYNFYFFIIDLFEKLSIYQKDFHNIDVQEVCTLYRLICFLKKKIENEKCKDVQSYVKN